MFSVLYLKIKSILVQTKVGSSCPPLLRGKRSWVSSTLFLTCREDWVGWEPQGRTGGMRYPVGPWTEVEGSLCSCAHAFFSAALQNEPFAISSPALQSAPLPCPGGRVPSMQHAHGGRKLSCVAACFSSWEGSSRLSHVRSRHCLWWGKL